MHGGGESASRRVGESVKIILNGETYEKEDAATLADLLKNLGLADRRVAVLLDNQVVRKSRFAETRLTPECKVDLIQMVGGG